MAEQLPIWQDPGVEPPALLKTNGWQPGMKPSAQHMNWLFNRIYKCLEEIQAGGGTEELEKELAALQQALTTHLADNVKHISESERTNWNGKAPAVHTHTIAQVTGLQNDLDSKIDESMINVPNGVLGLDASGNVPASLGVEAYKLLYSTNFANNPATSIEVANLGNYKKIKVIAKRLGSADTTARGIRLYLNGLTQDTNNIYVGSALQANSMSTINGVLPSTNLGGGGAVVADFVTEIDAETGTFPRHETDFFNTQTAGTYYAAFGLFKGAAFSPEVINSLSLTLMSSTIGITAGTLEVWGVAR